MVRRFSFRWLLCVFSFFSVSTGLKLNPESVFGIQEPLPQCSCDCCASAKRLPSQTAMGNNGQLLEYLCVVGFETEGRCPKQCNMMQTLNILEYSRFCMQQCQPPALAATGAICTPDHISTNPGEVNPATGRAADVSGSDVSTAAAAMAGGVAASDQTSAPPKSTWQASIDQQLEDQLKTAQESTQAAKDQRTVVWDMRKLIAERLRAEVGADMAHGAAAGENVRINSHVIDRSGILAARVSEGVADVSTGMEESVANATADALAAKDAAKYVQIVRQAAKGSMAPSLRNTDVITEQILRQNIQAAADDEATAYAQRSHWDKPSTWGRVLANKAAEPYVQAMSLASERARQYENYARNILKNAQKIQSAADTAKSKISGEEGRGDISSAVHEGLQAEALEQRAQLMDVEARQYWNMADRSWKSVRGWQKNAYDAAAWTSRAYMRNDDRPS